MPTTAARLACRGLALPELAQRGFFGAERRGHGRMLYNRSSGVVQHNSGVFFAGLLGHFESDGGERDGAGYGANAALVILIRPPGDAEGVGGLALIEGEAVSPVAQGSVVHASIAVANLLRASVSRSERAWAGRIMARQLATDI